MKKIIVPVDFSEDATNALEYARLLFQDENCTFFLLNVYVSNRSTMLSEEYSDVVLGEMSDESKAHLIQLRNSIVSSNQNEKHTFEIISVPGKIVAVINQEVPARKIDYIVMATRGATGAKEIFLGSNAVRIINGVNHCPIIIVPKNCKYKTPETVVFSTNFKRMFYANELQPLLSIIKKHNSKLNVARVMIDDVLNETQKSNREILKEILKGIDYIFYKIDIDSTETTALKEYAQQSNADLITLIHHKFSFFQKILEEDVVDKITFSSPIPLLILPELN